MAQDTIVQNFIYNEGDIIELKEALLLPDLNLKDNDERLRYLILRRKTLKVYPYAKMAAERLSLLQLELETYKKRRQKKKYSKKAQKYIEEQFSEELKKLTKTEGQILVKLIHRQTGQTAYALVKNLRNGWRAFWYNGTAHLFDISLKREFNPLEVEEDYLIEDILQRAFNANLIKYQSAAFPIDYYKCHKKWRGNANPNQ